MPIWHFYGTSSVPIRCWYKTSQGTFTVKVVVERNRNEQSKMISGHCAVFFPPFRRHLWLFSLLVLAHILDLKSTRLHLSTNQGDYTGAPESHPLLWKPNRPKIIPKDPKKYTLKSKLIFFSLIKENWSSFLVMAWLPKRLIFGRNRNLTGSANLLSLYTPCH